VMLHDHREVGEWLWERFNAPGPEDVVWYYGSLAECYSSLRPGAMAHEFAHEVERLRKLVRS
jgi:hypothetical protein